jgi:hypothetical protein
MARVEITDLPPKVRAQIAQRITEDDRRRTRSRAGISDRVPCPGHCHNCGQAFPTAHAWQLHADAVHDGNARWDIDLPNTTPTATT